MTTTPGPELVTSVRTLIERVREAPTTPGWDSVLCLLEAVELLLPALAPTARAPDPGDLDGVRDCLRAASVSLRAHLWQRVDTSDVA